MHWRSFISGCIGGSLAVAAAVFVLDAYNRLDAGISLTYQQAALDTLRQESDVLRRMAEPDWIGLSTSNAKERLISLEFFDFEKGSEGLAAGPVYLKLADGYVVEIQTHCARMVSEGCKEKEED